MKIILHSVVKLFSYESIEFVPLEFYLDNATDHYL